MANSFNISGQRLVITPALDEYARGKLGKLDEIFKKITTVHIVLSIDNLDQKAAAEIKIAGDPKSIFAEASTDNMYKSIDELEHKLMTQVKKYHSILTDHHKK